MNIRNIKTYYLNSSSPEYAERFNHMENLMSDLKFTNYERYIFNFNGDKELGTTLGHISLVKNAIKNDEYPFTILEDDVEPIYDFKLDLEEEIIEISDIIYLGASLHKNIYNHNNFSVTNFNNSYYKVAGLFTLHSIIITKRNSAEIFLEYGKRAISERIPLDACISKYPSNYTFLSPKDGPYFFQPDYLKWTNFLWLNTKFGVN